MILLTGATGTVGSALLRRLVAAGESVRCLVRDPTRLGAERVRVQLALGDLGDPGSFRNAVRGVDTVIHLAASIRDQPRGSIEELTRGGHAAPGAGRRAPGGRALHVLLRPRRRPRLAHPLLPGQGPGPRGRGAAELETHVFEPSIVYAPGDPWITLLERLGLLPLSRSRAAAARSTSRSGPRTWPIAWWPPCRRTCGPSHRGYESAGPQTISYEQIVRVVLRASGRRRRLLNVPLPVVRGSLRALGRVAGPKVFATWEEAEWLEEPMTTARGTADAEALGVTAHGAMREVLAAA